MPRPALARTTFIAAAASGSLFATLAYAGDVPIGAYDVIPDGHTSSSQALVGELLAEKQVPFSIDDWTTGEMLLAGTVEQRVVLEAEKQSLAFHYLITNTPSPAGTGEVFQVTAFSFGELVQTDVGYLIDDAAAGNPSRIGRTHNAIDASFDGAQRVLEEGRAISFFVRTNATAFDETGLFAIDAMAEEPDPFTGSRVRTTVADGMFRAVVLEGPVAVPLPAAVWTGVIGLATAALAKRRVKA
ncbi:MAG TPA: hypothetical protein VGR35_11215 [Tepidisphaeraceae bacterium]|nr:hypothetical protein [Tepidisphaeraceae bacterium]